MENKNTFKKISLVAACAALVGVLVGGSIITAKKNAPIKAGATDYIFTMDKDHLIASNWVKIGSTNYNLWINTGDKYTAGTTNFGTIAADGYLENGAPIYGITAITANLASGSMRASFHYDGQGSQRKICLNPISFTAGSASTVSIEGKPDYFYLEFPSETVITSISITYSCSKIDEPTQETGDYLDLGREVEGLSSASDLSWMTSTSHVNGGTRAHRIVGKKYGSGTSWPSLLIGLATPFAVTTTGHLEVDAYGVSGKTWVSFKLYNSSWAQFDTEEHGCDFNSTGFSHQSVYKHPSAAGTVAFVRITVDEVDSTAPVDIYLDNLTWVEG